MSEKTENAPQTVAAQTEKASDVATGYAVYDRTLLRYVSRVTTKAEATKAAKNGPAGHQLEVRKV